MKNTFDLTMRNTLQALLLICFFTIMMGCEQKKNQQASEEAVPDEAIAEEPTGNEFGEPVDVSSAISLSALESTMGDKTTRDGLTVTGKVTEVCQKKGCWMKLEKENGEAMRVTFKDYALFMPKDIAGKDVVIRGKAYSDTVTVDVLRHFAEDAGKSQAEIEAITEPEIALAFEADGVVISN